MRPQIQEMVDGYLDEMIGTGPPADLVRDFALPVPSLVISLLLGVPSEDLEFSSATPRWDSTRVDRRGEGAGFRDNVRLHVEEMVERKEREPGDDLISRLVTDYVATGQLNRETAAITS